MQALQMIAGQGGWPLNIFLSPDDLVPLAARTFLRRGTLRTLGYNCTKLRRYYDTEKQDLRSRTEAIFDALQQAAVLPEWAVEW